jgi:ADP-ribose pyrophosphatase YjhB (NUDIX family)
VRPGFGVRYPGLDRLLSGQEPVGTQETAWLEGSLPLRVTAYLGWTELPPALVTSVRWFVRVRDQLVVCQTPEGGWHPWPGGRREPDESYEETACREVHEETGWFLEPDSFDTLGWLHLQHLRPPPDGYPYPHPDFLQVVYVASANSRDGGPEVDWTDTDGYEVTSRLVSIVEARSLTASTDMPAGPFFDVIERTWRSDELAT